MYLSEYTSEIKHAVALRFTEYYRWQLSLGEKKALLRGFTKLVLKAYSKTKVANIKAHLSLLELAAQGQPLTRIEAMTRLAGLFFFIDQQQAVKLQVVNPFSQEAVLTRCGAFLSDFDAFFRDLLETKETTKIISAIKRDKKKYGVLAQLVQEDNDDEPAAEQRFRSMGEVEDRSLMRI